MKTIPKRSDLYTNPTDLYSNHKEQMSQLLEIKNILSQKLKCLTKLMSEKITDFYVKNYPQKQNTFNLMDYKKNLFGTNKSFFQFSKIYKQTTFSIESDVKGVIQTLQKYSFTKSLSTFINEGILANYTKMNDLMLKREEFCNNIIVLLQKDMLQGRQTLLSKRFNESVCSKCTSLLEKQKINQTKQQILLGGNRMQKFYDRQLEPASQNQEINSLEQNFYSKLLQIKQKVKQQITHSNTQMISQQAMKWNLSKLQSNIEQRKFDILACLIQMGEFGKATKSQAQNIQKILQQKNTPQNLTEKIDKRLTQQFGTNPKGKLPPMFDYNKFSFDVGKHFRKQIKALQSQIQKIKKNYNQFLFDRKQRYKESQTQCNIIKDVYEKELQKYKRTTDRQLLNQNSTIKQLNELNKKIKDKLDEYENVIKVYISSKLDQEKDQLEKLKIELRIPRLIQKYQTKLKQQQNQIKQLKLKLSIPFKNQIQSRRNSQQSSLTNQKQLCENISRQSILKNNQHISNFLGINSRKKKMNYLKSFLKRVSHQVFSQVEAAQNTQITQQGPNQFESNLQGPKILQKKLSLSEKQQRYDQIFDDIINNEQVNHDENSLQYLVNNQNLNICPNVFQIKIQKFDKIKVKFSLNQSSGDNKEENQKLIQLQNDQLKQNNQPRKNDPIGQTNAYKQRQKRQKIKTKLMKAKSQSESKLYGKDLHYEQSIKQIDKTMQKKNKKISIKRYASQHTSKQKNNNRSYITQKISTEEQKKQQLIKETRKLKKVQSVFLYKKETQSQLQKEHQTTKLPSISQHQQYIKNKLQKFINSQKLQKVKEIQKSLKMNDQEKLQKLKDLQKLSNNKTMLTKKRRNKRNFSQQNLIKSSGMQKNQMEMSLGGKFTTQNRSKTKKQYIIDFIPKIQQQSLSRNSFHINNSILQIQSGLIQKLFQFQLSLANNTKLENAENPISKKPKHHTKTILVKNGQQINQTLSLEGISLSTKIYSILATIKCSSLKTYQKIIQKIKQEYLKTQCNNKTNCDQILIGKNNILEDQNHLPLSLQTNYLKLNNSYQMHSINDHQENSNLLNLNQNLRNLNSNQLVQKSNPNILNKARSTENLLHHTNKDKYKKRDKKTIQQNQVAELKKIISHLIMKHTQICINQNIDNEKKRNYQMNSKRKEILKSKDIGQNKKQNQSQNKGQIQAKKQLKMKVKSKKTALDYLKQSILIDTSLQNQSMDCQLRLKSIRNNKTNIEDIKLQVKNKARSEDNYQNIVITQCNHLNQFIRYLIKVKQKLTLFRQQ